MSFGGSVASMLTSLKNNKRPRVSAFEKASYLKDVKFKPGKIHKKASPELLLEIKNKMRKQNRRAQIINLFLIILTLGIAGWLFYIFE